MMLRAFWIFVLAVAGGTGAARADLQMCNRGTATQSVAIAYNVGEDITSEGWWVIAPGACSTIIKGDLTERFIWWRANQAGSTFDGDTYFFCTTRDVFTLTDAGGDCAAHNLTKSEFRRIDAGKNKNWRLDLDPPPVPAPLFAPGTYGQPFTATGLVQDCGYSDERYYCDIYVQGRQYRTFVGTGTPDAILIYLAGQPALAPVQFGADILGKTGTETDVAVSYVIPTAADAFAPLRERLQGNWESEEENFILAFDVQGSENFTVYPNGLEMGDIGIAGACPGGPADVGPVLLRQVVDDDDTDGVPVLPPDCYAIGAFTDDRLELREMPAGGTIVLNRLP